MSYRALTQGGGNINNALELLRAASAVRAVHEGEPIYENTHNNPHNPTGAKLMALIFVCLLPLKTLISGL